MREHTHCTTTRRIGPRAREKESDCSPACYSCACSLRDENEALRRAATVADARAADELRAYRDSVDAATAQSRGELGELRAKRVIRATEERADPRRGLTAALLVRVPCR